MSFNERLHWDNGFILPDGPRDSRTFNTPIYSLDDRYRGIKKSLKVIFVHPDDLAALGVEDGQIVDVHSEYTDNVDRVIRNFKVVGFPTSRGCAATYFPEENPLVPLGFTAEGSNTPASKSVVVRLEPSRTVDDELADFRTGAAVNT